MTRKLARRALIAASVLYALAPSYAVDKGSEDIAILQKSKPLVTRAGAWQTWNDSIHLQAGQEKLPLTLSFINGAEGRPKFTGLHVHLARQPIATLKEFNGHNTLSLDMTGKLRSSNTAIAVQGFGPPGGRLIWKLTTRKPIIVSVTPNPFKYSERVTIHGRNFAEPGHVKVLVGAKQAKVLSAKSTEIQFEPPHDVAGGSHDVTVIANSVHSNTFHISAKTRPQVSAIDFTSTPPGQPLKIFGHGSSTKASENIVKFGTLDAHVISSTETCITCIVPEMHFPQFHVPISVTRNGLQSKEHLYLDVDVRVIPNEELDVH